MHPFSSFSQIPAVVVDDEDPLAADIFPKYCLTFLLKRKYNTIALMTMPISAPVIVNIFGRTNEMTLTTNPMVDSTTPTSQAHLLPVNRPNATTNDAIHRISIPRGMYIINNSPAIVKIDSLSCSGAV